MNIPDDYVIHDIRPPKDFTSLTISGYKRTDVIKAYTISMISLKLEDSIRWCVELHATGCDSKVFETIFQVYMENVNVYHPKFFFYFLKQKKYIDQVLEPFHIQKKTFFSRNHQEVRNILIELTSIITLCKKNNMFSNKAFSKIDKHAEEKSELQKRMIANNLDELNDYIFNSTTKDMKLALNEILWNLSLKQGTYQNCIYWYYWLEKMVKKNKPVFHSIEFSKSARDDKKSPHFDNWIFIMWKIISTRANSLRIHENSKTWIKKLEKDYKENFKLNSFTKNRFHIFIAFYLLKHNVKWDCNLYPQEHLVIQSIGNVNQMYGFISTTLEQGLNNEQKNFIRKKYYQTVFLTMDKIEKGIVPLQKVVNTQINTKNIEEWNRDDNIKEQFIKHQKALERKKDINVVQFTHYPDMKIISPPNDFDIMNQYMQNDMKNKSANEDYIDFPSDDEYDGKRSSKNKSKSSSKQQLISKNKNLDDIYEAKQEKFNKKLDAFTQFVTKKKEPEKSDKNSSEKSKSVLEMMNDNSNEYSSKKEEPKQEFKVIKFDSQQQFKKKSKSKKHKEEDYDEDYNDNYNDNEDYD